MSGLLSDFFLESRKAIGVNLVLPFNRTMQEGICYLCRGK